MKLFFLNILVHNMIYIFKNVNNPLQFMSAKTSTTIYLNVLVLFLFYCITRMFSFWYQSNDFH